MAAMNSISATFGQSTNHKFMMAVPPAAPVGLSGVLARPKGNGPFAAVVMLHGCGGPGLWGQQWSPRLVSWGYVAFRVDSFGPRGKWNVCGDPTRVLPHIRARDAHAAKAYLAGLPFVDENRIAVIGMSHGGWSTLSAVENPRNSAAPRANPFKAAVALYPWCDEELYRLDAPLLILIGEVDDWTPAFRCERMETVGPTRHAITLKVYPGATHSFDVVRFEPIVYLGHNLKNDPEAARDAVAQVKAFLAKHLGDS
jgi:dienelactone hydrolase